MKRSLVLTYFIVLFAVLYTIHISNADISSNLLFQFHLDEGTGSTASDPIGGKTLTLASSTAAPTWLTAGSCKLNGCLQFDGSNDWASTDTLAFNGSSIPTITLAFWLYWDSFANDDKLAIELSTNSNNFTGTFVINPNESSTGAFVALVKGNNGYSFGSIPRPSAAAWHCYVIVLDITATTNEFTNAWVDKVSQTITQDGSNVNNTGNFGDFSLFTLNRGGASNFAGGRLDELWIFSRALNATDAGEFCDNGQVHGYRRRTPIQ